ncbi:MAG: DUF434 domain-containing protein [Coprococcus sp.]
MAKTKYVSLEILNDIMGKVVKRGYVANDKIEFAGKGLECLKKAAEDTQYLLNHGYTVKSATTFVGNHYMLSERQRLALARAISSYQDIEMRKEKQLCGDMRGRTVHIDGFNTIISLEVALSGSILLHCSDGTVRDLAGLRGTYRIIDKTEAAACLILTRLQELGIEEAVFYLDAPVSNSGRLKMLLLDVSQKYKVKVSVNVIADVDRVLEKLPCVISSDAIILNRCRSWLNLTYPIVKNLPDVWLVNINEKSQEQLSKAEET